MPPQELRSYQQDGVSRALAAWKAGARSVLAVSPTGSGKTTIFSFIASQLAVPVVILVHRRELATQAATRLREFGVDFGLILSGEPPRPARVQIASVQTLVRRTPPPARLVICDEAHLSTAATWSTILGSYPTAKILGATATPWRLSGKPLAGAYDACVVVAHPRELREQGHLCDYTGFSYLAPDLSGIKTTGGDYNEKQSSAAMRQPVIVANVVEQWLAHARDLSTVVFAVTVEHSLALTAEFRAAGIAAEHLDGKTPKATRDAILQRVANGATRVLCNVGVAIEGLDIPRLKCCVLARPTKSLARYLQMTGRVRRPWQGVTARIHDHAFLIKQHGLPDDDRDYSLDAKIELPASLTRCEICFAWYRGNACPACSHENEKEILGERQLVTVDDAEIFEFDSNAATVAKVPLPPKPPIEVRWDSPGRKVEGRYTGIVEKEGGKFGAQRFYVIEGPRRTYHAPATAHLRELMARINGVGESIVRITYDRDQNIGGSKWKKLFKLEVDNGEI